MALQVCSLLFRLNFLRSELTARFAARLCLRDHVHDLDGCDGRSRRRKAFETHPRRDPALEETINLLGRPCIEQGAPSSVCRAGLVKGSTVKNCRNVAVGYRAATADCQARTPAFSPAI
jgi:hypothetical protein